MMSKVLLISPQPFFEWRGSPIRVRFDAQALSELGHEVDLLTLPVGQDRDMPGVRIVRVRNVFRVHGVPIGPSLVKVAFDVLLFFKGWSLARKRRYDVIHGIEDAGLLAVAVARLVGAKAIFEKHSDPSSYSKGFVRNVVMRCYAGIEGLMVRRSDAVICTGPGLAEQATAAGGKGTGVVHHVPDIPSSLAEASPERTAAIRKKLQDPGGDRVIVTFVGSFAIYQGVDLMFEAMPAVARSHPRALFVVIGGTEEELTARITRLAEQGVVARRFGERVPGGEAGAAANTLFLGKVPPDELPDYLSASDVLLSPRRAGVNTPLKLLDYLKAGRAIVATDGEANRLIVDDSTALLVRPEPAALAEGIGRLVDDVDTRRRLGENGRKLMEEKYNFGEFKRQLGECYGGVLNTE